jgi:hypothetical protein
MAWYVETPQKTFCFLTYDSLKKVTEAPMQPSGGRASTIGEPDYQVKDIELDQDFILSMQKMKVAQCNEPL